MNILELENKPLAELRNIAREYNVVNANRLKRKPSSYPSARRRLPKMALT